MSEQELKYFHCKSCRFVFQSDKFVTTGDDVLSECPICSQQARETSYRVANLALGWDKSTGPVSEEGKSRSRLNAYKHGRNTSIFTLMAPAKPGKYPLCHDCEYFDKCKSEKFKYCPTDLETVGRFVHAYKEGKVSDLKEIAGLAQSQMHKIFQNMIHHILTQGVALVRKVPILDGEGEIVRDEKGKPMFNTEFIKNNLVKDLPAFVSSMGFDAVNQDMTPKTRQESETLKGFIGDQKEDRESLIEVKRQAAEEMKRMRKAVENLTAKKALEKFEAARDEQSTDKVSESG